MAFCREIHTMRKKVIDRGELRKLPAKLTFSNKLSLVAFDPNLGINIVKLRRRSNSCSHQTRRKKLNEWVDASLFRFSLSPERRCLSTRTCLHFLPEPFYLYVAGMWFIECALKCSRWHLEGGKVKKQTYMTVRRFIQVTWTSRL